MNSVTDLRLCDIATHNVLTVTADLSLQQVIAAFVEKRVSSIIVVEDDRPVGIVTERDLLRLICSGYDERRAVRSVMSAPLLTARQDLDFATAQSMLANRAIRHLVLVDDAGGDDRHDRDESHRHRLLHQRGQLRELREIVRRGDGEGGGEGGGEPAKRRGGVVGRQQGAAPGEGRALLEVQIGDQQGALGRDALVVDLRENGGGAPDGVALLSSAGTVPVPM